MCNGVVGFPLACPRFSNAYTVSIPATTLPKIVCFPFNHGLHHKRNVMIIVIIRDEKENTNFFVKWGLTNIYIIWK
jgi:hypothetical protein